MKLLSSTNDSAAIQYWIDEEKKKNVNYSDMENENEEIQ